MMMKYTLKQARNNIPTRKNSDNKTAGGKCLILGGSEGLWGAAILCATAAARCGAGYVHLLTSQKNFPVLKNPDFLNLKTITRKQLEGIDAVALGPGLISRPLNRKWITFLIKNNFQSVVLDAGPLNILKDIKLKLPKTWILTPHEGELSRMLTIPASKIRQDRLRYIKLAQRRFNCIILLKGHGTLVADSNSIYQIKSGNVSLAKAGTGDVLTGMIAAFLSQGLDPIKAATLAAFAHGFLADQWLKNGNDILSLMASDLVHALPKALYKIRKK